MADKRDRLVAGVADLAGAVGAADGVAADAAEAARLAKADQGAILVAEFSELEGYVAAVYARLEGVDEAVALAVEQQYLPEGPDSPLPSTEAAALLAAAEKVDNLIGAFAVGEAPTGSKDPYGLRRAAAGLVRIALDRDWDVDPCDLLAPGVRAPGGPGRRADRRRGRGPATRWWRSWATASRTCSAPRAWGPRRPPPRWARAWAAPRPRRPGRARSRRLAAARPSRRPGPRPRG